MASPGPLRAPLLWLLVPFMTGLVIAELSRADRDNLPWLVAASALLLAVAWLAEIRATPLGRRFAEAGLLGVAFLAGWAWLPLRAPPPQRWTDAPREVNVVLEVEQVYAPAPGRRTFSGLARIVRGDGAAARLAGERVYFAAIRRISRVPEVSGHYEFRGLIESVPAPTGAARGFDRHLQNLGVGLRLMRGRLGEEVRAPHGFRRFCARAQDRLAALLGHGLERHPELVSLHQAMLLGEKAVLSQAQENAFMRSGVFHIFSISGLHVGVIAGAILAVLGVLRVPRRVGSVVGLAVLWLYVQVTGASTPAERAFLMIAFFVSSRVFLLPGNPLAALAGAALVTLLLDPRQLFTTGFQMSYSVVTALVVLGGPLADAWRAAWKPWRYLPEADWNQAQHFTRWLGGHAIVCAAITWTACLASTPSSIANFGLFSPGALLGNLLVVPLASLAIVAGFVALLFGLVGLLPVTLLVNHAAAVLILVMDRLVQRGTELPGVYFPAAFAAPWMGSAALVAVTATMLLAGARRGAHRQWWPVGVLAAVLILGVNFG